MGENSKIEWTDHTFNPWMGCTKVSPACANCYAERDMDKRYGKVAWGPVGTRVLTSEASWKKPLQWNREAKDSVVRPRVFCASLADVFEDWQGAIWDSQGHQLFWSHSRHPSESKWHWIVEPETAGGEHPVTMNDVRDRLFATIDATPKLDWLLLTKRPDNVSLMWPIHPSGRHQEGMSFAESHRRDNVWLGTSIENQEWANKRLPYLHAAKRHGLVNTTFVSAEPLVGHVTLQGDVDGHVYNHLGEGGIDWVISGGESGPDARPADPDWFRSLRDQCAAACVPFHFKQWGEFDENQVRVGKKKAGRLLDGVTHDGLPSPLSRVDTFFGG